MGRPCPFSRLFDTGKVNIHAGFFAFSAVDRAAGGGSRPHRVEAALPELEASRETAPASADVTTVAGTPPVHIH
jgi:hypothetical protein